MPNLLNFDVKKKGRLKMLMTIHAVLLMHLICLSYLLIIPIMYLKQHPRRVTTLTHLHVHTLTLLGGIVIIAPFNDHVCMMF